MSRNQKGFTLIELLIVVAIIGILAAIAIPNLLTAMQRAKQKRTMADIRSLATAWEARGTDTNQYTAAGRDVQQLPPPIPEAFPDGISALAAVLEPTYIKSTPIRDGWGNEYWVGAGPSDYAIASGGRDGVADSSLPSGPTTNFDCDIVFQNGSFTQYPEGVQKAGQTPVSVPQDRVN